MAFSDYFVADIYDALVMRIAGAAITQRFRRAAAARC